MSGIGRAAESLADWISIEPQLQPRDRYLQRRAEALLQIRPPSTNWTPRPATPTT
jgi:hypothetical protein